MYVSFHKKVHKNPPLYHITVPGDCPCLSVCRFTVLGDCPPLLLQGTKTFQQKKSFSSFRGEGNLLYCSAENCSSSVEPFRAVVEEVPPETIIET